MERHPGMEDETWDLAVKVAEALRGAPVNAKPVEKGSKVLKVDDALGLVFGWAIVCTEDGQPYFDTQDDHIPESSMLKAAADFMEHSRVLGDMHQKAEGGSVVFAFPMTGEVAKAYGLETKTTGLMIAVKPATSEILEKYRSGEYSGFSIGGRRILDEDV